MVLQESYNALGSGLAAEPGAGPAGERVIALARLEVQVLESDPDQLPIRCPTAAF